MEAPKLYTCSEVKYLMPSTRILSITEFICLDALCFSGKKAKAIKYLRNTHYLSLIEARAICTAIQRGTVVHS